MTPDAAPASADQPLRAGLESIREAGPSTVVIFGATGDLTRRKLLPAIYNLALDGFLPTESVIVGVGRRDWDDAAFQAHMREGVDTYSRRRPAEADVWKRLAAGMRFLPGNFDDPAIYERLLSVLAAQEARGAACHLFYLATPPTAYAPIARQLEAAGLVRRSVPTRIVIEKPFGSDLASARALNGVLCDVFREDQIFRIDHYLGKETVQNLLVFRLDNRFLEPLWNGTHVDHVQITVAESEGVGDRGGYYDQAGVARDMLQNHMLQLLTLVAMEPPVRFDPQSVRDEKVKVLRAIRPPSGAEIARCAVRGQYGAGVAGGVAVPPYLQEAKIRPGSTTETYLAVRLPVDTWRWGGTPFYLRSGRRLPKRATEIAIVFAVPPYELFRRGAGPKPNVLRIRIQPEEGISFSFQAKSPGQTFAIDEVRMDFTYATSFARQTPEAYERLLLDALLGDSTLFARGDEVELSWELVDRLTGAWAADPASRPEIYEAGTWGPAAADRLLEAEGRRWVRV